MWILPKQLRTFLCVVDTEGLSLDLNESSQLCAQSLFVRSKPLPSRTWLQKWKRDSWTQHLFGRILKPSHGSHFVTVWTSLLAVIPASHSQQPANASERTTHATSGQALQQELPFCAPESASLKTLKDTLALDSEMSLQTWNALVTKCRGDYSQRLNAARHTNGSGCSSWPTAKARDWKDTAGCSLDATNPDGSHRNRRDRLMGAVMAEISGPPAPDNYSTHGSRQESWATPRCSMAQGKQTDSGKHRLGEQVQHNTNGKLNPRWVETLMGLPVGWTMASCVSPVTIELTSCACLATELFLQPQNEHSEF